MGCVMFFWIHTDEMKILLLILVLVWRTVVATTYIENRGNELSEQYKRSQFPALEVTTGSSSLCATVLDTHNNSGYPAYQVGETIQLACSLTTTDPQLNISLFYLLHYGSGERLEPSSRAGNQAVFEIQSAKVDNDGTYQCYYGDCREKELGWNSFLQINIVDLSKPELECIGINYNLTAYNISCTWSRHDDRYSSTWLLQYAFQSMWSETLSPLENCTSEATSQYVPSQSCSFMVHHFWTLYMFMRLQIHLKEDLWIVGRSFKTEFKYTVPLNASIVKLNPVTKLTLSAEQPREMTLTFWFDHDGTTQMITDLCNTTVYYWKTDEMLPNMSKSIIVNTTSSVTKILTDLEPFTVYTIEVRVKPLTSRYWSVPAIVEGQTLPEAPVDLPTQVGYTSRLVDQNSSWREINLYWEPLPSWSWHGPNGSYIVNITCETCLPLTEEIPANSSLYTLKLANKLLSNKAYKLTIQTRNSVGVSEKIIKVTISKSSTDSKPDQVTYVEREPGVFDVVVKDTKSKSSRVNYTLYWCQGYTQTVPFCVRDYNSVQSSEKNFTVQVNQSAGDYAWLFGAAVEDNDQCSSIVWAGDQSAIQVSLVEDDTTIRLILGLCGGGFLVAVSLILVTKVYSRLKKRMYEIDIKDIIIERDNITDIIETETDSEDSGSLTDSVITDNSDTLSQHRPHVDGFQDTDSPYMSDVNIKGGIATKSASASRVRDSHLENESGYQDADHLRLSPTAYLQNEVMVTVDDEQRKAMLENETVSTEMVADDVNIPRLDEYVFSDDILQVNKINETLENLDVTSENGESKGPITHTEHNQSILPAYVQCNEIPKAVFYCNGKESSDATTALTEVENSPEQSADSYVHSTDFRNSEPNREPAEQSVKTEENPDYVTETVARGVASEEIKQMFSTFTQKHKDEQLVTENTKVEGIRTRDSVVDNEPDQNSDYMAHDCKEIMKTSNDAPMIGSLQDPPFVDNIELLGIATTKHSSDESGSVESASMADDSIEAITGIVHSTIDGSFRYIANTGLPKMLNSNLPHGIGNSFEASSMNNNTFHSTDAAKHENVDETVSKLSDNASGSINPTYLPWDKVGMAVDKVVNDQETCPPYVVVNTDSTLSEAKSRQNTDDSVVDETDSIMISVKSSISNPTMALPQQNNIDKDVVLPHPSLNEEESRSVEDNRIGSDGMNNVCDNIRAYEPEYVDGRSSDMQETNIISEENTHSATVINDESKSMGKANDNVDAKDINSYVKAYFVESQKK